MSKNAELGENVTVGPFSIIEDDVRIGDGTSVGNYSSIMSGTTIGTNCKIFHNCTIGEIPQDLKFGGEKTSVFIGNNVTIRESVTINRGTAAHGTTEIGDNILLMAYVHIAHDCIIGNNVVFANLVTLGGHVEVHEWSSLGGGVLVHQFCKVGSHSFIGGGYRIVQDVPPYILAAKDPLEYSGMNRTGLKRRGFSLKDRNTIKRFYQYYFRSKLSRVEALKKAEHELSDNPIIKVILEFIRSSERGII